MSLNAIDPREWVAISALLDEVMELPEGEHARWLAALPEPERRYSDTLRRLLAEQARIRTSDFMGTLPKLADAVGEPAATEAALDRGERDVGPYRLLRELGRGGMGTVWLARRTDGLLKREVALKLPHAGLATADFAERLARERDILATLAHPNIARLYDAGVTPEGQAYLAIEHVEGQPLTAYCDERRLRLRDRIGLLMQVAAAVQHAHQALVVHRDLKPSNILVTSQGEVRLLDFGIAKLLTDGIAHDTELTQQGGRPLTPEYASPEQISGQPIGTASDVYALGVLLCGQRPYALRRASRGALEEAIVAGEPVRPSTRALSDQTAALRSTTPHALKRALAGDLDVIVLKALKKDPAQRYATADALREDLQRHLDGQAVLARPDGALYRVRKFVARHRVAVAAGAVGVLALATATVVSLKQAGVARENERAAEAALRFVEDIFKTNSSDRPDPVQARKTTARELLDIGARRVDATLGNAPGARFRIGGTLVGMYDDLDLRPEVLTLQRKQVELARTLHGARSAELAEQLVHLADAAERSNQRDAALPAAQEARSVLDALGDNGSPTRALLELELGRLLFLDGAKLDEALVHARRANDLYRSSPASEKLVESFMTLAGIRTKQGFAEEGHDLMAQALRASAEVPGGMKRRQPELLLYAADAEESLGNFDAARARYEQALEALGRIGAAQTPQALGVVSGLGSLMHAADRYREAVDYAKQAVELAGKLAHDGNDFSAQAAAFDDYAIALLYYGHVEETLDAIRTADRLWHAQGGVDRDARMLAYTALAQGERGDFARAHEALDRREALLRTQAATRTNRRNEGVVLQIQLLLAEGRAADAAKAFESLALVPGMGGNAANLSLSRPLLEGRVLLANHDVEGAKRAGDLALALLDKNPRRATMGANDMWAQRIVGEALHRSGQAAQALPFKRRALELAQSLYDPKLGLRLAEAQLALAECELDLGQHSAAVALRNQARAIHAAHPEVGPQHRAALRTLDARLAAHKTTRST